MALAQKLLLQNFVKRFPVRYVRFVRPGGTPPKDPYERAIWEERNAERDWHDIFQQQQRAADSEAQSRSPHAKRKKNARNADRSFRWFNPSETTKGFFVFLAVCGSLYIFSELIAIRGSQTGSEWSVGDRRQFVSDQRSNAERGVPSAYSPPVGNGDPYVREETLSMRQRMVRENLRNEIERTFGEDEAEKFIQESEEQIDKEVYRRGKFEPYVERPDEWDARRALDAEFEKEIAERLLIEKAYRNKQKLHCARRKKIETEAAEQLRQRRKEL